MDGSSSFLGHAASSGTIPPMNTNDWSGNKVVVMGLGRFGGGIAVAKWLSRAGARVVVTDSASAEKLGESLAQLDGLPIEYRLGGHDEADLEGCDLLVVSPAVPREKSAFVKAALAKGVPISSEMNLFLERCPARRVVGITGSAGKSTTTAMIGAILEAAQSAGDIRRGWVGGNIGRSLLADLPEIAPEDVVVLELSSCQLEDAGALRWSPPIAVITNIEPNHLDRHGTMEAYAAAKLNLVRFQATDGVVILHEADAETRRRVEQVGAGQRIRLCRFDPAFEGDLVLPGEHNRLNAAAAIEVARTLGLPRATIARGLAAFRGLPHRLEFVATRNGVRYYNDSKSTTPESTMIALHAFGEPTIVLVGGQGKNMPYDQMAAALRARAKAVICYGAEGPVMHKVLQLTTEGPARIELVASVPEAVSLAAKLAAPGDVVVLSPACTSYDAFTNYEQRGEAFRQLVEEIK